MLANLLPGIRELRTPLAVGYVWLLTFWLWLPEHFKATAPTVGVPGDIARLTHYSGRLGVGIALSFIAYLIGALSVLFNGPLVRIGSFLFWYTKPRQPGQDNLIYVASRIVYPNARDFWSAYLRGHPDALTAATRNALRNARYRAFGFSFLSDTARQAALKHRYSEDDELRYLRYLIETVYAQGNVLLGREAELFAAYDRLIAEFQFRIGVSAPLIALIVTLAIRWTPLSLLALLPLLLLLRTGCKRRMQAGDVLADAVRQERLPIVTPVWLVSEGGEDDDQTGKPNDQTRQTGKQR